MAKLHLKPQRDRSVRRFHQWIYSGAVHRIEGAVEPGEVVDVVAADGTFLGRGFCNRNSNITGRMLTWKDETIGEPFFLDKLSRAFQLRRHLISRAEKDNERGASPITNAFRIANAEGDGLPGLIVDQYADYLVVQIGTMGMHRFRDEIVNCLQTLVQPTGVFERSTGPVLLEEGMKPAVRVLAGQEPPDLIRIRENNLLFDVNVREGQKTGFFLDQRENRRWAASFGREKTVLNGFGYTGAFSVFVAHAGARRVVTVDSSGAAVNLAKQNFAINGLAIEEQDFVVADLFHYLRATTLHFDFIILDPPAFAHRQKDAQSAARAYKDINLQAMKKIEPGGLLLTCSCSQPISPDLFQKILFAAATDAGRPVRIIGQSHHPPDHPISIYHPEGRYLQAYLLVVE